MSVLRSLIPLFALTLLLSAVAADNPNAKLKQSAEELGRVRARIEAANQRIERDRGVQSEQRAAVEVSERRIVRTQLQLRKLAAAAAAQEVRVREAKDGHAAAERQLEAQKDLLARQLRAAYVIGQTGRAQLLLSQQEPDRVSRLLTYFDYMNRASAGHIEAINAELVRVQAEQDKYEAELKSMRALETQRKRVLAELETDRVARAQAVATLDERIAGDTQQLKQLQGSEKELQALLQKLRDALADVPVKPSGPQKAFPEMRGKLSWPLRGRILADYGDAKSDSRLQWKGLWISAGEGAAVRASARGRVAYVGWLSSYGLIIVVEHEKGFFTLYGHNASVAREAGDNVAAGDVIASVGNTGGYEQPGLYFEVRRGTEPLDPKDWLSR